MLVGIFFVNNFNAQTPVCNLEFDIFEFSINQPINAVDVDGVKAVNNAKTVDNAKAILTDLTTNKTNKSSDITKTPLFRVLLGI